MPITTYHLSTRPFKPTIISENDKLTIGAGQQPAQKDESKIPFIPKEFDKKINFRYHPPYQGEVGSFPLAQDYMGIYSSIFPGNVIIFLLTDDHKYALFNFRAAEFSERIYQLLKKVCFKAKHVDMTIAMVDSREISDDFVKVITYAVQGTQQRKSPEKNSIDMIWNTSTLTMTDLPDKAANQEQQKKAQGKDTLDLTWNTSKKTLDYKNEDKDIHILLWNTSSLPTCAFVLKNVKGPNDRDIVMPTGTFGHVSFTYELIPDSFDALKDEDFPSDERPVRGSGYPIFISEFAISYEKWKNANHDGVPDNEILMYDVMPNNSVMPDLRFYKCADPLFYHQPYYVPEDYNKPFSTTKWKQRYRPLYLDDIFSKPRPAQTSIGLPPVISRPWSYLSGLDSRVVKDMTCQNLTDQINIFIFTKKGGAYSGVFFKLSIEIYVDQASGLRKIDDVRMPEELQEQLRTQYPDGNINSYDKEILIICAPENEKFVNDQVNRTERQVIIAGKENQGAKTIESHDNSVIDNLRLCLDLHPDKTKILCLTVNPEKCGLLRIVMASRPDVEGQMHVEVGFVARKWRNAWERYFFRMYDNPKGIMDVKNAKFVPSNWGMARSNDHNISMYNKALTFINVARQSAQQSGVYTITVDRQLNDEMIKNGDRIVNMILDNVTEASDHNVIFIITQAPRFDSDYGHRITFYNTSISRMFSDAGVNRQICQAVTAPELCTVTIIISLPSIIKFDPDEQPEEQLKPFIDAFNKLNGIFPAYRKLSVYDCKLIPFCGPDHNYITGLLKELGRMSSVNEYSRLSRLTQEFSNFDSTEDDSEGNDDESSHESTDEENSHSSN